MEFGLFSNGFRPHTTAAETFEEDLQEIVLVAGKCWADRDKRLRSLRLFAEEVRPRLAHLTTEREPVTASV